MTDEIPKDATVDLPYAEAIKVLAKELGQLAGKAVDKIPRT